MRSAAETTTEDIDLFDLVMAVLAVVALVLAGLQLSPLAPPDSELSRLLDDLDLGVCLMFLADFVRSVIRAPDRWRYLRGWGIFDLISAIPVMAVGQGLGGVARGLRLVRLIRVLRAIRSVRILVRIGRRDPSVALLAGLILSGIVLFIGCCIGVLWAEGRPRVVEPAMVSDATGVDAADVTLVGEIDDADEDDHRLDTADEVLWWAVVTSATVGYGDYYPETNAGRAFAVGLMIVGIGAFATLTSTFGVLVGRVRRRGRDPIDEMIDRLQRLEDTLERLERRLAEGDRSRD
jgi:voltage-gated potassium channel